MILALSLLSLLNISLISFSYRRGLRVGYQRGFLAGWKDKEEAFDELPVSHSELK